MTFQCCILCGEVRELNLQALDQHRENCTAACNVLPSGADPAAHLSPQSYAKPTFMGPQNRRDGKHPDAMIKNFRALFVITQDSTHRVAIYSGTQELIQHKSRNKTSISDEQLHPMELCIYHCMKVQVEGVNVERISQMCRCAGNQSWRRWNQSNYWVWVKQSPGRCYGALNRCLPWQLQRLFKITLQNEV